MESVNAGSGRVEFLTDMNADDSGVRRKSKAPSTIIYIITSVAASHRDTLGYGFDRRRLPFEDSPASSAAPVPPAMAVVVVTVIINLIVRIDAAKESSSSSSSSSCCSNSCTSHMLRQQVVDVDISEQPDAPVKDGVRRQRFSVGRVAQSDREQYGQQGHNEDDGPAFSHSCMYRTNP
jgi:hypothetical protein